MRIHIFSLLPILALLEISGLLQATTLSGPTLTAEKPLVYDDLAQTVCAQKNAILRSNEFLVHADEILWDRNNSKVKATGNTIVSARGIRLLCDKLVLNLQNGNYEAQGVKAGFSSVVLQTDQIKKRGNKIKGNHAVMSDPGYFEGSTRPSFFIQNITFDENKSLATTSSGLVKVGKLPLSPIPPLKFKTGKNQKSFSANLKAGKRSNLGWYVGKEIEWEVAGIETNLEIVGLTKRGVLLTPKLSYESTYKPEGSPWVQSFITFGWIRDQGKNIGLDQRGLAFSKQRNFFNSEVIVHDRESLRLASELNYESDSEINRDFYIEEFSRSQSGDHFLELAYEPEWGGLSTLHRWQINEHEGIIERRPNLRLELSPSDFFHESLFHSLSMEYSDLVERDAWGRVNSQSTKLDTTLQTFRPIRVTKGLTYTPMVTLRNQLYQTDNARPKCTWIEGSQELKLHMYADYSLTNELWEIHDLRHSMDFTLRHAHLNLSDEEDRSLINSQDFSPFMLNLEPVNLMNTIEADRLEESDIVRLDWNHQVVTDLDNNMRELLSLRLSQDLWKEANSPAMKAKSFYAQADLHPARWLQLRTFTKQNNQDSKKLNVFSAFIQDGFQSNYQISRVKYPEANNQWIFSLSRWIDHSKRVECITRYDSKNRKFPYWRIAMEIQTAHSIDYTISLSERNGTAKEDELAFNFGLRVFSF